jgi:hypothetical protein
MKVTEVVDITEISSSKTEHIYTATPTRILKLGQIDKGSLWYLPPFLKKFKITGKCFGSRSIK